MIEFNVLDEAPASFGVSGASSVEWGSEEFIKVRYTDMPDYTGETEWTPTEYEQVIPTEGTTVRSNIIVHRIPSNYGRIDWNGAALTVS